MESLLQAVLFFDEVYYLDDYKTEFKQNRYHSFPGLIPITLDEKSQQAFSEEALNQVQTIVPRITAGSFTDGDFKPFFEMLKMNMWYVWNMQSSVLYLTQKLLADASRVEIQKYSALSSMIFSELKDKTQSNMIPQREPVLLGSDGKPITVDDHVTKQAQAFFAGLNWLAYRTVYYTVIANQLHLDLFLHPIRQAFQVNFFQRNCSMCSMQFHPLIEALTKTTASTMARVYNLVNPHISSYPLPIFSAYIAAKSQKAGIGMLEAAYHMREEGIFVEARHKLDTLEQLYIAGNGKKLLREANQIQRELSIQMRHILDKYKVTTPQGSPTTNMISFWDTSCLLTGLPKIKGADIANTILQLHNTLPKGGFSAVYKSILLDLPNIQALGDFHEQITKSVRYDQNSGYYEMKIQDPAYKKAHSGWSIPM